MKLVFRLIFVIATAAIHNRRGILRTSRLRFCVLPNDLDLNLHMNNGRYLSVFDLGKIDIMISSGAAIVAYRHRWRPLVGANVVRYRFGLGPFHRFQLVTRILCWDEKWFYFQHEIETKQGLAAVALSKALLHGRGRSVPPEEVLAAVEPGLSSPPMPDAVSEWLLLEQHLRTDKSGGREQSSIG